MKKAFLNSVLYLAVSIFPFTGFSQHLSEAEQIRYLKDTCSLKSCERYESNSGPFELGELFTVYETPYLNDHSVIYNPGDKKWHLFGIISPATSFIHLTADSLTQRAWEKQEAFSVGGSEIWAPHIILVDDVFHMFYTQIGVPREIRHVTSSDLFNWSKSDSPVLAQANKLSENLKNKDPMVFWDEGNKLWIMYYSVMKDDKHWVLGYSTSVDLIEWSKMKVCFDENTETPGVESPFVVKRDKHYYLFLSARPWPIGGEDIFVSKSPYQWSAKDMVMRINPWHAAELVQDLDGQWYLTLSSGIQCNDMRMAPLFWNACNQEKQTAPISDFSELIQPASKTSVLEEEGYYVWGGSVVKGDDDLYHMFYSRWKQETWFSGWVTHSEIAHAVSENAEGPFIFRSVALPARGADFWDGLCTHNPTVKEFDGKYYLYYMGNTGDGLAMEELNFTHRNNQRIGVAWADSPNGPWHRSDVPFVDVSADNNAWDALMVSNPSVTRMRDGKYLVVYKAVAKHNAMPFGGPVTHLAAIAHTPDGPIKKINQRIFYKKGEMFPAEDPFIWYQKSCDRYYAIVKDMHGVFTNAGASLALFESEDGLNWSPAENPLASELEVQWQDGTESKLAKLERPQILFNDGELVMLYCASGWIEEFPSKSFNIHIPLKLKKTKQSNLR